MYKVRKDSDQDRQRKDIAKVVRSAVRLHYSLLADQTINDVLPEILDQHALAVSQGKPFQLDMASLNLPKLPGAAE